MTSSIPSSPIDSASPETFQPSESGNWVYRFFAKGRNLVPIEKRSKLFIYLLIVNASMLDSLNTTSMFTSLLDIQKRFDTTYTNVSWITSAYALTLSGFIMLFGRMGDIIGHHNVFLVGICFFCLFSLICAVIENEIVVLILFRALQGICASASIPSSFALMVHYYSGPNLSNAITGLTLAITGAIGVGILLGGAFGETPIGYKGFFYLSFALSFISAIFGYFYIIPMPKSNRVGRLGNLNFFGGFILVAGFILVVLGLTEGGEKWNSPKTYIPLPIGLLLITSVLVWERYYIHPYQVKFRANNQETFDDIKKEDSEEIVVESSRIGNWTATVDLLIPVEAWKVPNIFLLITISFLNYGVAFGSIVSMVQYYSYIEKNSPILAAAKIIPFTITIFVGSAIYKDNIAQRIGKKYVAIYAFAVGIVGNVLISRINYNDPNNYWKFILPGQIIYAYGANLFFILYLNLVISNTPLYLQGIVTGICQAFSQTGVAVCLAAVASILGELNIEDDQSYLHKRFQNAFYFFIALAGMELILILFLKNLYENEVKTSEEVEEMEEMEEVEDSTEIQA